jgi:hypothetical protein
MVKLSISKTYLYIHDVIVKHRNSAADTIFGSTEFIFQQVIGYSV